MGVADAPRGHEIDTCHAERLARDGGVGGALSVGEGLFNRQPGPITNVLGIPRPPDPSLDASNDMSLISRGAAKECSPGHQTGVRDAPKKFDPSPGGAKEATRETAVLSPLRGRKQKVESRRQKAEGRKQCLIRVDAFRKVLG